MVLVEGTCTYGGGILRRSCGEPASGLCVYCGEPFCSEHGQRHPDYHEICVRPECQDKYNDVQHHRVWIEQQRPRNDLSMCAQDGCDERMQHLCQRCRLRFCSEHLQTKPVMETGLLGERSRVTLLLCEHCAERRRIWD